MCGQLRVRFVWVLLAVVGMLLAVVEPSQAAIVTFPDANLEAAVRDELGIPAPTPITDTDMKYLNSLSASFGTIANIQGLEYGTYLNYLALLNNQISDITPVTGLTDLDHLSLWNNQISDIGPVLGLTNLDYLNLGVNLISDIGPVSGLTNLTKLYLQDNQISDISAVSGLTDLTTLWLYNNQFKEISAVSGLTDLTNLGLDNNLISDISAVSGLTNLRYLYLDNNQISDISAVPGLTHLSTLSLQDNLITDISDVSGLMNLYRLRLDNNYIETMNLNNSGLVSLGEFSVGSNPLTTVLLIDATLGQASFDALMDGGDLASCIGIAELGGVLTLDMSGVDFTGISDLSKMYTMDDLEALLLAEATNLDGSQVVPLLFELDSLDWLDVRGLWASFDAFEQYTLNAWDAAEGNTLITVPSPIPGDINQDGTVDKADAKIMALQWGTDGTGVTYSADINEDGSVNAADVSIMAANWGAGSSEGESSSVPEPGLVGLLMTGLLAVGVGFRRRSFRP